jgi:hypothetical protein
MAKTWSKLLKRVEALEKTIAGMLSGKKPAVKKAKGKTTKKKKSKKLTVAAAKIKTKKASKAAKAKPTKKTRRKAKWDAPIPILAPLGGEPF